MTEKRIVGQIDIRYIAHPTLHSPHPWVIQSQLVSNPAHPLTPPIPTPSPTFTERETSLPPSFLHPLTSIHLRLENIRTALARQFPVKTILRGLLVPTRYGDSFTTSLLVWQKIQRSLNRFCSRPAHFKLWRGPISWRGQLSEAFLPQLGIDLSEGGSAGHFRDFLFQFFQSMFAGQTTS